MNKRNTSKRPPATATMAQGIEQVQLRAVDLPEFGPIEPAHRSARKAGSEKTRRESVSAKLARLNAEFMKNQPLYERLITENTRRVAGVNRIE